MFCSTRSAPAIPIMCRSFHGKELGRPLHLLADSVRSFIWAKPNHTFIGGDFSSIEGRIAAWYRARELEDQSLRRRSTVAKARASMKPPAASIYNIPVQGVSKPQRQVGKIAELALGFGGGVGALSRMAKTSRLDLSTVYPHLLGGGRR
jgi:DNA polymerase